MTVTSLAPKLEPGARIGKYRLVRRLAVGGMGEVWVARNRATRADVAVKLCHGNVASEEAGLRFRHEARVGAMLSHRSIVRTFDLVEEPDGTLLLVMELLRGDTLERHLKAHGPLPAKEAIAIAVPVLSALAHAHDCGVVHRDITPSNIFLAIDPDRCVIPKLVDFGIAKLPASGFQTLDGRALGTPRYMSPEQIRTPGEIDGRSDLFGMGVVLFEVLTGTSPFAAKSPSASLAAVLEAVVDPDPRIEPRVWIELQRAMSKRPYERHGSAREMADALRAASGETEEALAALLRRVPMDGEEPLGPLAGSESTQRDGGQSVGPTRPVPARRGALTAWLTGGVLAVLLAIVATAAFRNARSNPTSPATLSVATTIPVAASPGPPVFPKETSIPAAAAPVAPTSSARTPSPNVLNHTRRVKPVATTPGF